MEFPKVSIIILNWNGLKDTIECLESLKKIMYPNYEVIVVDNNSSGKDASVINRKFKNYIKLIKNEKNYGFTKGNNIGAKYAKGDYLLFLNNDTIVEKDFLKFLVDALEKNKKAGIGMPVIFDYYSKEIQTSGNSFLMTGKVRLKNIYPSDLISEVDYASGAALIIKRSNFERLNGFNEKLFMYGEDLDLSLRNKNVLKKINVCVKNSHVYHKGSVSVKKKSTKWLIEHETYGRFYNILYNYAGLERIVRVLLFVSASLILNFCEFFKYRNLRIKIMMAVIFT
jgi:GT2 family glycosyltransferase